MVALFIIECWDIMLDHIFISWSGEKSVVINLKKLLFMRLFEFYQWLENDIIKILDKS